MLFDKFLVTLQLCWNKNCPCRLSALSVANQGGQMPDKKQDLINQSLQDLNNDGVDRRGFLKCMAWAGTGLVWTMSGGVPVSRAFAKSYGNGKVAGKGAAFSFVQISDSHIGFNKPANPDVTATLQTAIDKINAMPDKPDFIIHTGDLSQLSKPSEFDTLDQTLKGASAKQIYFVPGEHDMLSDNGDQYLQRYGKGTKGTGWSSFDHKGAHHETQAVARDVVNFERWGFDG